MKKHFVILVAASWAALFASSNLGAASFKMVTQPKTAALASGPWKGAAIGIVGVTAVPVDGLPCFCFAHSLLLPTPMTGLVADQPFQAFFTLETVGFSGTADVSLKLFQAGAVVYELTGSLTFADNSVYAVSTNGATAPSSTGAAEVVITVTQGSTVIRNVNRVVII